MQAVAVLTDWRFVRTFQCEAVVQLGGDESLWDVHAEPNHSSYVVRDRGTGKESSYVDATRVRIESGVLAPYQSAEVVRHPFAVRLAFPLDLPIWGRQHDRYRMLDARTTANKLAVRLAEKDSASAVGELIIDVDRRVATRLCVPTLYLEHRNVQRAPSTLGDH